MKKIPSLNGLRAISIFMVIGYHLSQHFFFPNKLIRYFAFFIFNGPLGVNVFFVISGYLITTLLIREKDQFGNISLKGFYLRRTIRIFPAYYFLLFIYFLLQSFGLIELNTLDWLSSLTYTKQFFGNNIIITAHLWSLSVEEFFYLLWPCAFIITKSKAPIFLAFGIMVILCMRFLNYQYPLPAYTNTIFSTGDSLLVGCFIALYSNKITYFVGRYIKSILIVIIPLFCSVLINNYLYHLSTPNIAPRFEIIMLQKIGYIFFGQIGLVTNILIGLIIIYSINSTGYWFKLLNTRFLEFTGTLSYSIYLWQQLFASDIPWIIKLPIPLKLLFIFLSACFSYYLIEKPFLSFKKKIIQ